MPRYYVQVPATMSIGMSIEAETEEEAEEAAFNVNFSLKMESEDPAAPDIVEFELHEYVTQGNVCCAVLNDIEIEEEGE